MTQCTELVYKLMSTRIARDEAMAGSCCELEKGLKGLDNPEVEGVMGQLLMTLREQSGNVLQLRSLSEIEMRTRVLLLEARYMEADKTKQMEEFLEGEERKLQEYREKVAQLKQSA